ncbi:MAG: hypothetical protein LUD72_03510 [Bacteroidales bacterium]|nr:hypothetical protein [Bacteroidales bacterium]
MQTPNLLFKREIAINDSIHVVIPTVGEVMDNEDEYYSLVSALTSMPIDYMVQLDDAGIDFTEINEYELFLILFNVFRMMDTKLIFGDLDMSKFIMTVNPQNETIVLYDEENNVMIDRSIHDQVATILRKIHHLEKNNRKPGNKEAKQYMIERARIKQKRMKNRKHESELEELVIAMVNTEQYKYGFEGTRELTIYQFNESVRQVINKIDYEHLMHGIYAGTISAKDMKKDDLNWLSHK